MSETKHPGVVSTLSTWLTALCILSLAVFAHPLTAVGANWSPDRYLDGYEETTVVQPDDYSGKVVCTVVRRLDGCHNSLGVLYIHGYNDYFFQKEEGDTFVDSCYNFFAVDLRKYGRSLQEGQTPYECRNIDEYYPDIDAAVRLMREQGVDTVVLMGHSTGGLVAASYMNADPPSEIRALILNSPFLDWNMSGFLRKVAIPVVSWIGSWWPRLAISQGDGTAYAESLLKQYHGEWEFDTNLKTVHPRKVTAGWIRAITQAQKALRKHSDIRVPILLLHSDKSVYGDKWDEEHQHGDAVLNVEHISKIGLTLGPDVTEDVIPGGLHDLALSSPEVRRIFYDDIFEWLDKVLRTKRSPCDSEAR